MSSVVNIRNLIVGEGIPKICVPVMGSTQKEVLASAGTALAQEPDLIEWRVDFLADARDTDEVCRTLAGLRALLGETPLLFTFRTKREGGMQELEEKDYANLCCRALESGYADALDVEFFLGGETVRVLIEKAHACGVKAVLSNHDFARTPSEAELTARLAGMKERGADVAKIAVTPRDPADVLTLLAVTQKCRERLQIPLVTMSMGSAGLVSRLAGEVFGSALTFGSAGAASAPGQIPVKELRRVLQIIHRHS